MSKQNSGNGAGYAIMLTFIVSVAYGASRRLIFVVMRSNLRCAAHIL